jgi:hypothetical protein
MTDREHLLAIVEPSATGEAPLEIANDVVTRGGKATIVVLLTDEARNDFRRFADAQDLDVSHGEAVAVDRMIDVYTTRVGGSDTDSMVTHARASARDLLTMAADTDATSIAIPQQVARRRGVRKLVSEALVPVLVTPAA